MFCQEFQAQAVFASFPNGWMNTKLTLQLVDNIINELSHLSKDCYHGTLTNAT